MRFFSSLLFLAFLTAPFDLSSTEKPAADLQPVLTGDATDYLLRQWFAVDPTAPLNVERIALEPDAIGARFRLEFTGDDGQPVNGILTMPAMHSSGKPPRLALALHPMGVDHGIWFHQDNPIQGGFLTKALRRHGHAVLALDARNHGERSRESLGLRQILDFAHTAQPKPYDAMISGTLRDYRRLLQWALRQDDLDGDGWIAFGYSMGAQMSLLLAALEPGAGAVLAMVPPYVDRPYSPSAPRNHVANISRSRVMLIGARRDPYSSIEETQQVFDALGTPDKQLVWFDSEHLLPDSYLQPAIEFLTAHAEPEGPMDAEGEQP